MIKAMIIGVKQEVANLNVLLFGHVGVLDIHLNIAILDCVEIYSDCAGASGIWNLQGDILHGATSRPNCHKTADALWLFHSLCCCSPAVIDFYTPLYCHIFQVRKVTDKHLLCCCCPCISMVVAPYPEFLLCLQNI